MELIGSIVFSALALLVTLGVLVTIHEYGHFRAARLCGVQVERFSIGMGKVLFRWYGKPDPKHPAAPPTEFAISIFPIGGYVKMVGEAMQGEEELPLQEGSLNSKPVSQRALIFAAGPLANFLLAIALYWLMFVTGVSGIAPVVGKVNESTPAYAAGVAAGDEIVEVDGKKTQTWQDVRVRMLDRLGESGMIELTLGKHESNLQHTVRIPLKDWLGGSEDPDLLGDLGIVPYHQNVQNFPSVIGTLLPEGRGAAAGLQVGDLITSANDQPVQDWSQWLKVVHDNPETAIKVGIRRNDLPLQLLLTPAVRLAKNGSPELDAS
ncbi:MAG TPA: RIP metalloprotease RseP, partial [Candidatus Acidoferrum sp.]|nr:RIP metalloprotease RseP [Candidatus Acidoferrum sp.]